MLQFQIMNRLNSNDDNKNTKIQRQQQQQHLAETIFCDCLEHEIYYLSSHQDYFSSFETSKRMVVVFVFHAFALRRFSGSAETLPI